MKMNRAINATQNGVACDEIPYECSEFGTIIPTQEDGMMNQDNYFPNFMLKCEAASNGLNMNYKIFRAPLKDWNPCLMIIQRWICRMAIISNEFLNLK